MRIAMISPTFPPDRCGVGDYSANLCRELIRQGHSVAVWTLQESPAAIPGLSVFRSPRPWNHLTLRKLTQEARIWKPDAFLIQYTPYLFAPSSRGVHPLLPFWIGLLRKSFGLPTILITHELHYPLHLTPAGVLLGIPHFLQFLALTQVVDHITFTYELHCQRYRRFFFWRKKDFSWTPVGTNIRKFTQSTHAPLLPEIPPSQRVLLHFGGAHPTNLFNHAFAALERIQKELGKNSALLFFIGITEDRLKPELERSPYAHLKNSVQALGYLSEEDVSNWIQKADLLLAPLLDGVSTRRTSVMAAFEHAKPVATTRAWSSNPSVPWDDFCLITPAQDSIAYAEGCLQLLLDPERAKTLGQNGNTYYRKNFSWPEIAKALVEKGSLQR